MKLQIFHHNGQLAEYELEAVTGLKVVGSDALETIETEVAAVNAKLHALIDRPGVAPLPTPEPRPRLPRQKPDA